MLTRDGARLQVFLELSRRHGVRSGPKELVILDEHTIERAWGWVFFYTTRGWRDGDLRYAVAGNGPLIFNRFDGTIHDTGTAHPVEYYIDAYEAELERQTGVWELVIHETPDVPLSVASQIRKVLDLSVSEWGELRRRLPCVWRIGARAELKPVLAGLEAAGISAEIRRSVRSQDIQLD